MIYTRWYNQYSKAKKGKFSMKKIKNVRDEQVEDEQNDKVEE